jgi:hypothetical protein
MFFENFLLAMHFHFTPDRASFNVTQSTVGVHNPQWTTNGWLSHTTVFKNNPPINLLINVMLSQCPYSCHIDKPVQILITSPLKLTCAIQWLISETEENFDYIINSDGFYLSIFSRFGVNNVAFLHIGERFEIIIIKNSGAKRVISLNIKEGTGSVA